MAGIMLALTFAYGMDCTLLAELPQQELESLVWGEASERERFCRPEANFECADYAPLMTDFGTLTSAEDGITCRFLPASRRSTMTEL